MALRILTLNVKMLPGPFGEGDDDIVRAERLAATILASRPKFDVVCLQEVFDEDVRDVFIRRFAPYALVPKVDDGDIFHEDSGLFFASRFAIRGHRFVEFDDKAGDDAFADKGIFAARLDTQSVLGAQLCVFHTHLQGAYDGPTHHADVRKKQLTQIRRFLELSVGRTQPGRTAVLLAGDLNVVGDTPEHADMLACLGSPRDVYREANDDPGYTFDGVENHDMLGDDERNVRQRLDYVMAFDAVRVRGIAQPVKLRCLEVVAAKLFKPLVGGVCQSDHFGVDVTYQ